jgi:CubicO group peptidase (beta-lactamase class C family)
MKKFITILIFVALFSKSYSYDFSRVDSLVNSAISQKYFPGAALIVANNQDILYEKYYGSFTYDSDSRPVDQNSLFDLASVTKVTATTPAIMLLHDKGLIDIDEFVWKYFPDFKMNGKEYITVKNLLLHNSGLPAWIPFYKTCKNKENVFDTICTLTPKFTPGSGFLYSDLNFIMLGFLVEKITGFTLDAYCNENLFKPLGMKSTTYCPDYNLKPYCLPTEFDNNWRLRQLQGEVHDEAASLLGGVSGNAGLFSGAHDLAFFMRMLLNEGKYYNPYTRGLKEEQMFKPETVRLFTQKFLTMNYDNTRAFGWDTKQPPVGRFRSQCGESISENCFGHTGYTGTSVWCDKERGIIVIFLTNRVYPSRNNEGIKNVRPDLHNLIFNILTN